MRLLRIFASARIAANLWVLIQWPDHRRLAYPKTPLVGSFRPAHFYGCACRIDSPATRGGSNWILQSYRACATVRSKLEMMGSANLRVSSRVALGARMGDRPIPGQRRIRPEPRRRFGLHRALGRTGGAGQHGHRENSEKPPGLPVALPTSPPPLSANPAVSTLRAGCCRPAGR